MNKRIIGVVGVVLGVIGCASAPSDDEVSTKARPSGVTLSTLPAGALLPDIVEEPPRHLNVKRAQQRELLRFTSTHWNAGAGTLQIRGGGQVQTCTVEEGGELVTTQCTVSTQEILNAQGQVVATHPAGVALFHPDHNHWHQDNVADFLIRAGSLDGPIVGMATKQTYCLIDYDRWSGIPNNSMKVYYSCDAELQGISFGFGDEYHHATHGQEIEITTLPPGVYYLTHMADPTNKWLELRDDNNFSWTKFRLRRDSNSGNGLIDVLEESPCADQDPYGMACGNTSNK